MEERQVNILTKRIGKVQDKGVKDIPNFTNVYVENEELAKYLAKFYEPKGQDSKESEAILAKIKKFFEPFNDSTTFSKRTIMAFLNEVAREFRIEVKDEK